MCSWHKPGGPDSWEEINFGLVRLYRLENAAICKNTHNSDTADWTEPSSWITEAVLSIISASNFCFTFIRDQSTVGLGYRNTGMFESPILNPDFNHITPRITKLFVQFFKLLGPIKNCLFISCNQVCSLEIFFQILIDIFFQHSLAYVKASE